MTTMHRFGTLRGAAKLRGLVPVLLTPLHRDESLDVAGLERLIEYVLRYPFAGVFALSTGGEDQNLPEPVIEEAANVLVRCCGGRIPTLVKTSSAGLKPTLERTRRFADLGIDAAVILFEHKGMSDDHVRRFFTAVADDSPVPIYLYHDAGRGATLSVDLMLEMLHHPNVAGIKAGGTDLGNLIPVCLLADPDASVFLAGGSQVLVGQALGASGHTAVPLLAFPEKSLAIVEHARAGRLDAARAEQRDIVECMRRMPELRNREIVAQIKAVLEIRGIIGRTMSRPYATVSDEQMGQIRRLIEEMRMFEVRAMSEARR